MSTELAHQASAQEVAIHFDGTRLNEMYKLAVQFHKAGCFGADVKNAEQALVKIQTGFEMGMPPMEAMSSLYIVNGKVTIFGAAQTRRLRQRGWKIVYEDSEGTDPACKVTISKGDETFSYTATKSEVSKLNSRALGFAQKDKLRWHAISRLIRFYVPEVMDAGVAYLREEFDEDAAPVASKVISRPEAVDVKQADTTEEAIIIEPGIAPDKSELDYHLEAISAARNADELISCAKLALGARPLSDAGKSLIQKAYMTQCEKLGIQPGKREAPKKEEVAVDVQTGEVVEQGPTLFEQILKKIGSVETQEALAEIGKKIAALQIDKKLADGQMDAIRTVYGKRKIALNPVIDTQVAPTPAPVPKKPRAKKAEAAPAVVETPEEQKQGAENFQEFMNEDKAPEVPASNTEDQVMDLFSGANEIE